MDEYCNVSSHVFSWVFASRPTKEGLLEFRHTQDVLLVWFATSKPLHFELVGKMNASFKPFLKVEPHPNSLFRGDLLIFGYFRGT